MSRMQRRKFNIRLYPTDRDAGDDQELPRRDNAGEGPGFMEHEFFLHPERFMLPRAAEAPPS